MSIKLWIVWGEAPELGTEPQEYEFATQAEADAFLFGVAEMDGWMGYTQVEHPRHIVTEEGVMDLDTGEPV